MWVNHDADLMDVTVTTAGKSAVIHSTQHHPFWDVSNNARVAADHSAAGDVLLAAKGSEARVSSTAVVPDAADMWDLMVANDHDFYVQPATEASVLVNNSGPEIPKASQLRDSARHNGWTESQSETGPLKFHDEDGVNRMTLKQRSSRTPGSEDPHVSLKNSSGQYTDMKGNPETRKSPGNHTPIIWDLS